MNAFDKIKKSLWVIFSIIMYINGVGFIYIGTKYNNKNWILEGVLYELPWFIYLIADRLYGNVFISNITGFYSLLAMLIMFIGIIRSVWVAVKLIDVYKNEEMYRIQTTSFNNPNMANNNNDRSSKVSCCLCIFILFICFALFAL